MKNKFIDILKSSNTIEVQMKLMDDLSVEIFGCLIDIHYGDKPKYIPSKEEEIWVFKLDGVRAVS